MTELARKEMLAATGFTSTSLDNLAGMDGAATSGGSSSREGGSPQSPPPDFEVNLCPLTRLNDSIPSACASEFIPVIRVHTCDLILAENRITRTQPKHDVVHYCLSEIVSLQSFSHA